MWSWLYKASWATPHDVDLKMQLCATWWHHLMRLCQMGLVETVSGTSAGALGWGKETGGGSPASPWVGSTGAEVSPKLCCCLGALLWSSCLAHPGSGLGPVWNRAYWLLLTFRVAFFKRQRFSLRLLPRERCGSSSFTGPGRVSSLTLTTGLVLSSSEGPGTLDSPCLFADKWKDLFSKENLSVWSWPFYGQLNITQQVCDGSPGEILQWSDEQEHIISLYFL